MRLPSLLELAVVAGLLLAAGASPATARQQADAAGADVSQLLPRAVGDRWLFGDREQQPTSSWMVGEPRDLLGDPLADGFVLESDDGAVRVLRIDPEIGLLLVEAAGLDPANRRYVPPLALLPATLEAGAFHTAESDVVETVGRDEVRRGVASVEVSIGAPAPLLTPAGEWMAWPVVTRTRTLWSDREEAVLGREELWLAPGVGPVQRRHGVDGQRTTEALLEAKIGDRLIPP